MNAYKKTAKDLAFDRERARLKIEIVRLREKADVLAAELKAANDLIDELRKTIVRLDAEIKKAIRFMSLSQEDLDVLLSDAKARASGVHMFEQLYTIGFGGYRGGL